MQLNWQGHVISKERLYNYVDYTINDQPFYVGKGSSSRVRLSKFRNKKHQHVSEKHGRKRIVVYDNTKENEALVLQNETKLIKQLHTFHDDPESTIGCNFTLGGETHVISEETRQKISLAMRGKKRPHSIETIEKIRKGRIGKLHSAETKQKMSEIRLNSTSEAQKLNVTKMHQKNREIFKKLGRRFSDETLKKMSLSQRKIKGRAVEQFLDDLLISKFDTITDAMRQTGISHSSIISCCKGKIKKAGGFNWRYATIPSFSSMT